MNSFDTLIKHFERFPGIGARQARRFVHHLLTEPDGALQELGSLIQNIRSTVTECARCSRFFAQNGAGNICSICNDPMRDTTKLMIVERDSDIQAIERSGIYDGFYFVLGGTIPLLDSEDAKRLRGGKLKHRVETESDIIKEIILAFSVNPDGENTGRYVATLLKDTLAAKEIKLSELGRGLSTGSELEYADPETIKNALQNRH